MNNNKSFDINYISYFFIMLIFLFADFDECQIDGTCEQTCHNLPGSYNCSCVTGYTQRNSSCIALNGKKN